MKKSTNQKHSVLFKSAVVATLLTMAPTALGAELQYVDPLDLPAKIMASASQSLLLDIEMTNNRLVASGERGYVIYSEDFGRKWQPAQVTVSSQLNALFFVDDNLGWAVGEDAVIIHTSDGGRTWEKQFDARNADIQGPLLDVYFENKEVGYAVGVFNKIYRTSDGGQTWVDWSAHIDNPDQWHLFSITASDQNTYYMTSEVGLLFRSTDNGKSFKQLQTPNNGTLRGALATRLAHGQDHLIAFGVGGRLMVSLDSGANWQSLNSGTQVSLSAGIWLQDGSALIVGDNGIILHVSSDLFSVNKFQLDNGFPLSGIATLPQQGYVLVGLGGVQALNQLSRQ